MVELRNLKVSDCDIIFNWIKNPELRKMTGTRGSIKYSTHLNWFEKKINDTRNIIKIIIYDSCPVGIVGTNEIDINNRNANIYIYIGSKEYRKKGIASKAIQLITEILFNEYDCHKIIAMIRSYNTASINLFEKCGFNCEGIQKDQVLYNGVFYDRLLYAKFCNSNRK